MLLKPVTAFALSAFVSIASFTASSAVAATNSSEFTASAPSASKAHHAHASKKASKKKDAHLALHSAEPKVSPKPSAKSSPKLAASLQSHLDLKNASSMHAGSKKSTIAATGKEVYIGGPTGHGARASVDTSVHGRVGGKSSHGGIASLHSKSGAMAKAGRAPSRPGARHEDVEPGSEDHPVAVVPVALRGAVSGKTVLAAPAAPAPCMHEAIEFVRGAETDRFPMTRCDGRAAPLAIERLSVLVRPDNAEHPSNVAELASVKGEELAPGVRRIDPGLVSRLQIIADHFAKPGMPERISIVSGYRPGSKGSFHASAQALDFHLEGVPNEALVDFCKTLENTGCGYYPNSSFVHVDVRTPGSGHVAWIDTSGPGESPHYVSTWPPPPAPAVNLAQADSDMIVSPVLPRLPGGLVKEEEKAPAASINTPLKLKEWE